MYALNNPLRFVDPSGYYNKPSPLERERANGEGIYYNWELAWKLGGNRTPFANAFEWGRTVGGYSYNWATGKYDNSFSGASMYADEFNQAILPAYKDPDHTAYGADAARALYGNFGYSSQLLGTDFIGNQRYLMTDPSGAMKIVDYAFWKVTGSYYNELYYFSGLVAFDTYAAKESMSYWDMIRTTDFPKPIMGMPPGIGMGTLGTYAKLAKITKGYKGAIQAHHLVEVRHLKRLMLSTRSSPAVILSKADHAALTKTLQQLLPYGNTYTRSQLINAYQQAYSSYPEWIKIVTKFLQ